MPALWSCCRCISELNAVVSTPTAVPSDTSVSQLKARTWLSMSSSPRIVVLLFCINRCEEPTKHRGVQVYDSLNRPPRADYAVSETEPETEAYTCRGEASLVSRSRVVVVVVTVMAVMITRSS